jgi:uncharacterized protein DUF6297
VAPARVAAARAFIGGRRRRHWYDWYFIGFCLVLAGVMLGDFLDAPFTRLTAGAEAGSTPVQAEAGVALVLGAAAGLVVLLQALGPLALSPADASWLLLTPLSRRDVLRRPALALAGVAALAGGLLGALALAMAGPFLPPGPHRALGAWLALSIAGGAGFILAAVLLAVLAQPRARWRARLRLACGVVAAAAVAAGVAGARWSAVSRPAASWFGHASTGVLGGVAACAAVIACVAAVLAWRMLPRFPASIAVTDSARAGTTLMAAAFLNVPLLTWIAEDSYWRGRVLPSRPWPRFLSSRPGRQRPGGPYPAVALAWADWRRLSRRPALVVTLVASALIPALAGAAFTGRARSFTVAAVLLAGAIAAGLQGTAATRRDTSDNALYRLLGVHPGQAVAARAVLPALLSAAWLAIALALLAAVGVLPGWQWPLLGLLAGPGAAAAALRIARTGAIDAGEQGVGTPMGPMPIWLATRTFSVLVGAAGCYPLLKAVLAGHAHGGTLMGQVAVSAVVLGGYLMLTIRMQAVQAVRRSL